MNLSGASISLARGSIGTVALNVTVFGGFKSVISLSAGSLPAGLTAVFSPSGLPLPGSGSSTLTISAGTQLSPGTYNLMLTASGGGISQTIPLDVTMTAPVPCTYGVSIGPLSATTTDFAGSVEYPLPQVAHGTPPATFPGSQSAMARPAAEVERWPTWRPLIRALPHEPEPSLWPAILCRLSSEGSNQRARAEQWDGLARKSAGFLHNI